MIKVIKKIVHTTVQFIHDLKRSWYSCIIKIKNENIEEYIEIIKQYSSNDSYLEISASLLKMMSEK